MTIEALGHALNLNKRELRPAAATLLLVLAFRANQDGLSFPGKRILRRWARLSEGSLYSARQQLAEAGLLSWTERAGKSTHYVVNLRLLSELTDAGNARGACGMPRGRPPHSEFERPDANGPALNPSALAQVPSRTGSKSECTSSESEPIKTHKDSRKKPKDGERKRRGTMAYFCPDDWCADDEFYSWAKREHGMPEAAVDRELAKFRRHEFARKKSDWRRCAQNWIARASENHRVISSGSYADKLAADMRARGML